jgi:putative transposase
MAEISYRRRFPPVVIQHAVWLYLRFTLSYRDVEELLAERGLDLSYETVRSWVLKFGPVIARRLRRQRPRASNRWHLDEMVGPRKPTSFCMPCGTKNNRVATRTSGQE